MSAPKAKVIREGTGGSLVPAEEAWWGIGGAGGRGSGPGGRAYLGEHGLRCDESAMTGGESVPVSKGFGRCWGGYPLADRSNIRVVGTLGNGGHSLVRRDRHRDEQ